MSPTHQRCRRRQDGASAVEYGLLVAAIAAIIVVIVFSVGRLTAAGFADTCSSLRSGGFSGSNTCP